MRRRKTQKNRHGLTLTEVVVSTMIASVLLVGALNGIGAVIRGRVHSSETGKAVQLAHQLMTEILEQDYVEPEGAALFGTESPESGTERTDWDDVDDYHGWVASPPEDRNGSALTNLTGWQREVVVEWVDPLSPSTTVGTDEGMKRITVIVRENGQIVAQRMALRGNK